ncbi:hypothetical protein J717_1255 [Acinetobacter baumannii 121738]|nr:hypothetical protein J717_1255 [Acinetobacter baumannii 121738]
MPVAHRIDDLESVFRYASKGHPVSHHPDDLEMMVQHI